MKNRSFPWAIVAAAAVAGAGFAGVASYVKANGGKPVGTQASDGPGMVVNSPLEGNTPRQTNKDEGATNSEKAQKASKALTLNQALKNNNYGEFRVLNVVMEDNGNAIVDFSKELLGGMGSGAESDFIELIKKTLAKFDDVKTFQIRVEGEIQKSLSHFELIDPVPVRD